MTTYEKCALYYFAIHCRPNAKTKPPVPGFRCPYTYVNPLPSATNFAFILFASTSSCCLSSSIPTIISLDSSCTVSPPQGQAWVAAEEAFRKATLEEQQSAPALHNKNMLQEAKTETKDQFQKRCCCLVCLGHLWYK